MFSNYAFTLDIYEVTLHMKDGTTEKFKLKRSGEVYKILKPLQSYVKLEIGGNIEDYKELIQPWMLAMFVAVVPVLFLFL